MAATDAELYARWTEGEREAGDELLARHLPRVRRFFAYKVTARSDAEDLVGKTLEVCAKTLGRARPDAPFTTFLFAVARNVLRDYIKARSRRANKEVDDIDVLALADLGPSPSVVVAEREEQRLLLEALRSIPLNYQIVLELAYFEGMSRSEIAQLLDRPQGTVASQLRLGRTRLDQSLMALADSQEVLESTMTDLAMWARALRTSLDAGQEQHA